MLRAVKRHAAGSTPRLATNAPRGQPRLVRRLFHRPRRLRRSAALRNLVRETHLTVHDFVLPLFVSAKLNERRHVDSMPGVFQLPVNAIADEARRAQDIGLEAVLLFGIPEHKDEQASGAYAEN